MRSLEDYQQVFRRIFNLIVHDYEFHSDELLRGLIVEDSKMVAILNHSTPLSWLPASCVLLEHVCRNGGGRRVPISVMDRFFFQNPILKPLAEYVTQFADTLSFDDVVSHLKNSRVSDVAIFPEGSNCFFGPGREVQPFRSPRFIELALETRSPIVLAVHRGSEEWARTLRLQPERTPLMAYLPGWLNEKIDRSGCFVVPKLPSPIRRFQMKCEFYQPHLQASDLSADFKTRRRQLWQEAGRVRRRMQAMFDALAS